MTDFPLLIIQPWQHEFKKVNVISTLLGILLKHYTVIFHCIQRIPFKYQFYVDPLLTSHAYPALLIIYYHKKMMCFSAANVYSTAFCFILLTLGFWDIFNACSDTGEIIISLENVFSFYNTNHKIKQSCSSTAKHTQTQQNTLKTGTKTHSYCNVTSIQN